MTRCRLLAGTESMAACTEEKFPVPACDATRSGLIGRAEVAAPPAGHNPAEIKITERKQARSGHRDFMGAHLLQQCGLPEATLEYYTQVKTADERQRRSSSTARARTFAGSSCFSREGMASPTMKACLARAESPRAR